MAPRTYLAIPYAEREAAKEFCKQHRFLRPAFDPGVKCWYYPAPQVPPLLSARWMIRSDIGPVSHSPPVKITLTAEQCAFRDTEPGGPENVLLVLAFAGAAKTTSLRAYTEARPDKRFLYLAFNNAVARDAGKTFPSNTTCLTTHALARQHLSPDILAKITDDLKPDTICDLLRYDVTAANLEATGYVKSLLNNFFASTDSMPLSYHLQDARASLSSEDLVLTEGFAQRIWAMMIDPRHPAKIPHDGYLKLFTLKDLQLADYDYILCDEAQDTNPAVEAFVMRQRIPKVAVGDPHQGLYGFRHARDILSPRMHSGAPVLHLTSSFRFGPQIAALSNILLSNYKNETVPLVGRGAPAIIHPPSGTDWSIKRDGSFCQHTIIARTNSQLFEEAVDAVNIIEAYIEATGRVGPKLAFIGTSERYDYSPFHSYKFGRLLDLVSIASGELERVRDPFLKRFKTIHALQQFLDNPRTADPDLAAALMLARRYKTALRYYVAKISALSVDPDPENPDPNNPEAWIIFSSAHRCKGLEWPRVRLMNDFVEMCVTESQGRNMPKKIRPIPPGEFDEPEEVNLLYVAVTRAKHEIEIPGCLQKWLENHPDGKHLAPRSVVDPDEKPERWRKEQWIAYFRGARVDEVKAMPAVPKTIGI